MKKPIAIIFNDVHVKAGNENAIIDAAKHMIKYAVENGIKYIIFAGDLFHSRSYQRQSVLRALDTILKRMKESNLTLYMFPGNHDKTVYKDDFSFLEIFRHYPNVIFNNDVSDIEIEGVKITLMPFWSDEVLIPKINDHAGSDVLISHFAMEGSVHLGHVVEKPTLNAKMLSKWKKTYLGHYHNHVEITPDIVHLPSFIQNDFGEDNKKGFSILYNDLSYELVKGQFREFEKISIDIDNTSLDEIIILRDTHTNSHKVIRFEFSGSQDKLDALDKSLFKDTGIDVKKKHGKIYNAEKTELVMPEVTEKYEEEDIKNIFIGFCENKGLDIDYGTKMLNEFFKNKT